MSILVPTINDQMDRIVDTGRSSYVSEPSTGRKYGAYATEEALISACRQNDRLAQKVFYEKYYGDLFSKAIRYTRSEEEAVELVTKAFFKIFTSLEKFENKNLSAWMSQITFNTCMDRIREYEKNEKHIIIPDIPEEMPINSEALDNMSAEYILDLVRQLPIMPRLVFTLYAIEGYKHVEIAEQLNIAEGTSKSYLNLARKELQYLLKQEFNEGEIRS